MKRISLFILLIILTSASSGYSQLRDTVINADINIDRKMERIEVKFSGNGTPAFTLTIDNKKYTGELINGEYAYAELIDINQNDGYTEIAIIDVGPGDGHDTYLFRFTDEIIPLGMVSGTSSPDPAGDGTARVFWWMGFWGLEKHYRIDEQNTLVEIVQDTYTVNDIEGVSIEPLELRAKRDEGSPVSGTVQPNIKIKILEADISPDCVIDGYENPEACDWYLIEAADGTKGWIQLKDFRDKIEGLIWAG